MDVTLEIHVPGLDMQQTRWTHHLLFMQEVHHKAGVIAAQARANFLAHGRGTLHVSRAQWMQVMRNAIVEDHDGKLPHTYLGSDDANLRCDFGILASGFSEMLRRYDPEREFVLTVEHHPTGLLSCYVIDPAAQRATE
jgi:hypothetical protein